MKILTFDVEEWFHLLDCDSTKSEKEWVNYEVRIHENVDRILEILDKTDTKATFFIIGWIAKTYPEVVKKIAERYEIGSHTLNHQLVYQQSRAEFKEDVYSSVALLEDITGKKVKSFRAPGFSIRESEAWAFETISECGIEIDCSIFPANHAHGGMSSFKNIEPSILEYEGVRLKEFPISPKQFLGKNIIYSGGGYFRLIPYSLISKWINSSDYVMSYIHPRDLDAMQPVIKELSLTRRFKSYYGLKGAETKLARMLNDFHFTDLEQANRAVEWKNVPIIKL